MLSLKTEPGLSEGSQDNVRAAGQFFFLGMTCSSLLAIQNYGPFAGSFNISQGPHNLNDSGDHNTNGWLHSQISYPKHPKAKPSSHHSNCSKLPGQLHQSHTHAFYKYPLLHFYSTYQLGRLHSRGTRVVVLSLPYCFYRIFFRFVDIVSSSICHHMLTYFILSEEPVTN